MIESKYWQLSYSTDPVAREIADRHYNRQKIGSRRFVPPGRCLVLLAVDCSALWVTSWPFAEYVRHAWAGAWVNSCFRNEGDFRSSDMIKDAVAITRWYYGSPHELGMITFINPKMVPPRYGPDGKPFWGYSYRRAKFKHVGYTKAGLVAMQLLEARMPEPLMPSMNEAIPEKVFSKIVARKVGQWYFSPPIL